ncbi:MAG: SMC-Scp complex subunit ScpB [Ignavibacteriae bacterium]|nr:MAG: SMC-Scp complex subunit ScpB [Ignavibacteriota bacterium]
MKNNILKNIVEVLIFSSDKPLSLKEMKDIINQEKELSGFSADIKSIEQAVIELMDKYNSDEYSFQIVPVAGAFRFVTKKDYAPWLARLSKEKAKRRLSQSALETLAIIAYNQPITRPEIEAVRGVNVDYIIGSLLEKDLITIKGRAEAPGRPMLYGTTDTMLEYLGINSIADFPPLKAIDEIIKSGPPEGVSQSDIDFYEEINLIKAKHADSNSAANGSGQSANGSNVNGDNSSDNGSNEEIKEEVKVEESIEETSANNEETEISGNDEINE